MTILKAAEGKVRRGEIVFQLDDWANAPGTDESALVTACFTAAVAAKATVLASGRDYICHNVSLPPGLKLRGMGFMNTRFKRTSNLPIFTALGDPYTGSGVPPWYGVTVTDLAIYNGTIDNTTEPLVRLWGCGAFFFDRVKFENYQSVCGALLETLQLWDSKFHNCMFFGGGTQGGIGAVRLLSDMFTYRMTKETFFSNCWWESYRGPGIEMNRTGTTYSTQMLHFNNIKMESRVTNGPHMTMVANNISFKNFYISFELTTGPVVDFVRARCIYGDMRFYYINSGTAPVPSCLVNIPTLTNFTDLDIIVSEPQPTNANIVTLGNIFDETIDFRINAAQPLVNGTMSKTKKLPYSRVRQRVDANTASCEYLWSKDGRPDWSFGNPANPSSTNEDFYIRNSATNFLTLRSRGAVASSSYREIIFNAHAQLGNGYADPNRLTLGPHTFWVNTTTSDVMMKNGVPSSDTDGIALARRASGRTVTAATTVVDTDSTIVFNTTSTVSQALPAAASVTPWKRFLLTNINTGVVTLTDTISGTANRTLGQWQSISVYSTGSVWLMA